MNAIEATVKKEKAGKKTVYYFAVNSDLFEAHYFAGKKYTLEIMHNGSLLGTIDNPNPKTKFEFIANSEANPIKITAWIDNGNSISSFIGKINGIGIEVDGKPVQHTLADPETHIKNGRTGLYILLFILGFKCIWTYYINFKEYASHIVAGISGAIYFIPLVLVLIAAIKYTRWTTFAIITGIVLSLLEMLDYAIAIPGSISSGTNGVTLVIWIAIRISTLYLLYNAWKWKQNKKERPISLLSKELL
jgi:hypothetical protein